MLSKFFATSKFDKEYAKLKEDDKKLVDSIVELLIEGKTLPAKFRDHQLKGNLKDFRDCHVKPDLVLIYGKEIDEIKEEEILIITAYRVNSHSELGL
ncbi:type II toxin-antitoxin system YafQ family toxin [uncultured Treponema sp.]|uniref:type II toxin-antitoxin system YafQ family toxin n=1 Tax=uncultured Treponema sp. TaxID=162155 RepID=UPI0025E06E8D|nr:type II toxin-antitoxin system YafQ family toxin [uncultured Treponema sp.]